jgi:hypothetical protein
MENRDASVDWIILITFEQMRQVAGDQYQVTGFVCPEAVHAVKITFAFLDQAELDLRVLMEPGVENGLDILLYDYGSPHRFGYGKWQYPHLSFIVSKILIEPNLGQNNINYGQNPVNTT